MNKTKFFSSLLVAALFASTSVFTSCKDYDDDISGLKKRVDALEITVGQINTLISNGSVIKSVTKTADGVDIVVASATGATTTYSLTNGQDGDDADVWTIVKNAAGEYVWAKNGVATEYPAQGPQGEAGAAGAAGVLATGANDSGLTFTPSTAVSITIVAISCADSEVNLDPHASISIGKFRPLTIAHVSS